MMNKPRLLLSSVLIFGLPSFAMESVVAKSPFFQQKDPTGQEVPPNSALSNSAVLVDANWLEKNLLDPKVRLIGLGQSREQYNLAHIPNEVFIDWRTEITDPKQPDRFNLPPKEQVEKLLRRAGVTKEMTIVLSDNLSSRLSTRMFWTLRSYGHQSVKLLDGGRKAWVQTGRDFTRKIPAFKPTAYRISDQDKTHYASMKDVRKHLKSENSVLIDGRPTKQFTGEIPGKAYHNSKEHKRLGHIIDAKNVVWADNFNADGTFKSSKDLKKLYDSSGATKDMDIITYCNEGLHAAPPWFVLTELLGYPKVKLYDDSMSEWANRTDTPMEKSDK